MNDEGNQSEVPGQTIQAGGEIDIVMNINSCDSLRIQFAGLWSQYVSSSVIYIQLYRDGLQSQAYAALGTNGCLGYTVLCKTDPGTQQRGSDETLYVVLLQHKWMILHLCTVNLVQIVY